MKPTALTRKIQQRIVTKPVIQLMKVTEALTANKYWWAGLMVCPFVTGHAYVE